jgi:hypothetical protein
MFNNVLSLRCDFKLLMLCGMHLSDPAQIFDKKQFLGSFNDEEEAVLPSF